MLNNKTQSLTRDFKGRTSALEFSPDGAFLALSARYPSCTSVFNASQLFSSTAMPVACMDKVASGNHNLSFSPSSSMLAIGNNVGGEWGMVLYKVGGEWEKVWDVALSHLLNICCGLRTT